MVTSQHQSNNIRPGTCDQQGFDAGGSGDCQIAADLLDAVPAGRVDCLHVRARLRALACRRYGFSQFHVGGIVRITSYNVCYTKLLR